MKHQFHLPTFPGSEFELETSIWTGKSKLHKDGLVVEQSKETGKPFLVPAADGGIVKAYPKPSLPDLAPTLEINGVKNRVVEPLQWHQYLVGALPILLLFLGGAIGGGIGAVGTITNYNLFRQEGSMVSKYGKVIGVVCLCYLLAALIAGQLG
jgi:hypothetical protein